MKTNAKVQITEDIREWDYGHYEGMTSGQIREELRQKGESERWDIWRDGCPGGEYVGAFDGGGLALRERPTFG